jgi:hypothetical protein
VNAARFSITAAGREALKESGHKYRRYPDRCYAVIVGNRRGPCGNSKRTSLSRFLGSGLIASARTDGK